MTNAAEARTREFYDGYWPANVPDFRRTREHIIALLPDGSFERALDAGCGTEVFRGVEGQVRDLFQERGLTFELVFPQAGRFKSSSNFVVRGVKAHR